MHSTHISIVEIAFLRACAILKLNGFIFHAMSNRKDGVKNTRVSYRLGHTNLKTKIVTVDIYTAKKRQPKKISAILAVIAHELAHHQKPPYRQRYRGRLINRIHYPGFYAQVKRNLQRFKKDAVLGVYFADK